MPALEVNGTPLRYEEIGRGTPCLLLHGGLGIDHSCFRPPFDRLAQRMRVIYFDQRCNGRAGRPPLETLTMEQLADDADALAERLGAGRLVVIGHS